jgi:hypothetical protein
LEWYATPQHRTIANPGPQEPAVEIATHIAATTANAHSDSTTLKSGAIVLQGEPGPVTIVTTFKEKRLSPVLIEKVGNTLQLNQNPNRPEPSTRSKINKRLLAAGGLALIATVSAIAWMKWGASKKSNKQASQKACFS